MSLENKDTNLSKDDEVSIGAPDARLTSFFTGLLLSSPVQDMIKNDTEKEIIYCDLFEAWSIGLLSASAPWRMVCALTASGILNICPRAISLCTHKLPTLDRLYKRLPSTVSRRVWAERAAFPVCSRYVQALIELLSAVKRTGWLTPYQSSLAVDAATPYSLLTLTELNKSDSETKHESSPSDSPFWEWDEGWVCSDKGWEVWTGSIECMAVEWKTPSRSAVR